MWNIWIYRDAHMHRLVYGCDVQMISMQKRLKWNFIERSKVKSEDFSTLEERCDVTKKQR